jgi:putative drug exporter of the RND superfamily
MRLSPQSLARVCSRHPWRTIAGWLLGIAVAVGLSSALLGGALTQDQAFTNDPEAKRAAELVEDRLRGPLRATEIFIVSSERATVDDPAFRARVDRLRTGLEGLGPEVVLGVQTYYATGDESLVSADRRLTILPTRLAGERGEASEHATVLRETAAAAEGDGFRVQVSGPASLGQDFETLSDETLSQGESVGLLAAIVVLIVVFGAVVAALLPIVLAVAAIAVAMGLVALVGQGWHFSFFVVPMISMMGLAVGIDYSLFIVSRYREERAAGLETLAAIEAAGATSSRAVFFSGMTVVLALTGMLMIPTTIFRSLAGGAIFVVLLAVAASMTLLPAVLGLLGDRVNRLRVRRSARAAGAEGGFWDSVTRRVMARPVVSLTLGVLVMLVAASSWLGMRTGFSGVSTMPDRLEAKQAFDVLAREFAAGLSSPVEIVVDGRIDDPAVQRGIASVRTALEADGFFGPSQLEINQARDLAVVSAAVRGDPTGRDAVTAIDRVRDGYVPAAFGEGTPADVLVGGETAFNKDFFDLTSRYMPIVFTFVLGLSFCLLTVAFRSIVVPLKAILLNLLSVGAAYGLIVLVSQKGVGNELFGFRQVEVIEAWLPLFLFSVLFGLSMDYHVFLLSRIRERYDLTGDNTESVAYGVRTTAGLITGAALIMVAVFGGFAAGDMVMFQQMGFGLAVAVLIDATLVRTVLVPASMKLLGVRNWYLPKWLEWLPKVAVEGPAADHPVPPTTAAREPAKAR